MQAFMKRRSHFRQANRDGGQTVEQFREIAPAAERFSRRVVSGGKRMNNRCTQLRASDRIWTRVMREGVSVAEAADEFGLSARRLEQLLIAVGRRRIARTTREENDYQQHDSRFRTLSR